MSELGARRHRARERALEILYEAAIKERPLESVLAALTVAPDDYAVALVRAAEASRERADALIEQNSHAWALERLALIDHLIMRLALGEWWSDGAPPTAVILDEAVELAVTYSTDGSGAFVNGVLAACVAGGR